MSKQYAIATAIGSHLGYPSCCIKEFYDDFDKLNASTKSDRPLYGTGFLCCIDCAQTKTEAQLLMEIRANRKHPLPFPMDDEDIVMQVAEKAIAEWRKDDLSTAR